MVFKFRPLLTALDCRIVPSAAGTTEPPAAPPPATILASIPPTTPEPLPPPKPDVPNLPPGGFGPTDEELRGHINRLNGRLTKLANDIKKTGEEYTQLRAQLRSLVQALAKAEKEGNKEEADRLNKLIDELAAKVIAKEEELEALLKEYRLTYELYNKLRDLYLSRPNTSRQDVPWDHFSPDTPFYELPEPLRRQLNPDYDKIEPLAPAPLFT